MNRLAAILSVLLWVMISLGLAACDDDSSSDDDNNDVSPADDDNDASPSDDDDSSSDDDDDDNDNDDASPTDDDDSSSDDDDNDNDDATPSLVPLYDAEGREIILHGGNFMAVEYGGTQIDYDRMVQDWGHNAVRILITWQALEPTEGAYDEDYLPNVVDPQVDWAYNAGLNVIVDMHQYMWSSCAGGMGMPDWTCQEMEPFDLEWLIQSGLFWEHPEYQDAFVAAWEKVATYFAGDERVFAYDLFNEPMAGLRTLPWTSENPLYRPLFIRLIDAVRAIHPEPYLIVEPTIVHGNGFSCVMDPIDRERLIYSPHLYPRGMALGGDYDFPIDVIVRQLNRSLNEANRLGMALLVGEVGLQSRVEHAAEYTRDVTAQMDLIRANWTWWAFGYDDGSMGTCEPDGTPKPELYPYMSRPYPRATAGHIESYEFDSEKLVFTLAFTNVSGLNPGAEIYINSAYHYPDGFAVSCSDPESTWSFTFDEAANRLTVTCDPAQAEHTIMIAPAEIP